MPVTIPPGVTLIADLAIRQALVQMWVKIGDLDTRIAAAETITAQVPALQASLTALKTTVTALQRQVQQNAPV